METTKEQTDPRLRPKLATALHEAQSEFTGLDFQPTSETGVYSSTYQARGVTWVLSSRMWRSRLHLSLHEQSDVEMKSLWSVSIARRTHHNQGIYTLYDVTGVAVETNTDLHAILVKALSAAVLEMQFEHSMAHMF